MGQKEEAIVKAAICVMSRYGVKRTTMNDIASAAEISRQTLYNSFANKDEILRAAVRHGCEQSVANVRQDWQEKPALGDRLDSFFQHTVIFYYDFIHSSPDADDIVSGFNEAGKDEIEKTQIQYQALLKEALDPYEPAIVKAGMTVAQLADIVCVSAVGYKYRAHDRAHLEGLLRSLKIMVLTLAGSR
ncbi:MAG: TetR/AcrR family transcriptional regulator [Pseudomonadota bacterium]